MATATLDVLNPATGDSIANVPNMSADEVDEAVARAKAALPEWLDATPGERAELLLKLADVISDNAEELAQIESRNVGKPLMVSHATRCRSRPTTCASSPVQRAISRARAPASTSRATRR